MGSNKKSVPGSGILGWVERGGNALPHPASLFGMLAVSVLFFSLMGYLFNWHALHPATGEMIETINLLSKDGLHRILLEMVDNYTGFAPLGIVMVA
ncbi:MAG: AbgT family transporter, partial [Bacteroidales bacterium]|nr:AbgT family transporter [Bacteroidales bacterium]